MSAIRIDLYSDTMTQPSKPMRRAMADAEVGDEQKFEDPTVNLLQSMAAELLGKEAALFLPSGTMASLISSAVHCRPGDEILCDQTAHILNSEGAGASAVAGAIIRGLPGTRGVFSPDQFVAAIRPESRYQPCTRMVSIEQTANLAGGVVWPLTVMTEICTAARQRGMATHMDGARLFNAVVASGIAARDYAAGFDSVWIDLSKGLGAPAGAVLAGSRDFIRMAWAWKQRLGGALRQAGILAAAGVYALRNNIERLAEDHAKAKQFARGLAECAAVRLDPQPVETNIVLIDVSPSGQTAGQILERLLTAGLRLSQVSPTVLRAVTHLDISEDDICDSIRIFRETLAAT